MNESEAHEEQAQRPEEPGFVLPGAQLAAQREALNWSVEQAAIQLNLAPRQIQAIEDDNYAALPGMASVRGFIRSYAKLLKMDPVPLLLMIANESAAASDLSLRRPLSVIPFSDNRLSSMNERRWSFKSKIAVFLLILLLAGMFGGQWMGWISILPQSLSIKMNKASAAHGSAPDNTGAVSVDNTNPVAATNAANDTAGPGQADRTAGEPAIPGGTATPASPPTAAANAPATEDIAADAKNGLVLKVREDSWIEIRRPDDSTLISRLAKAGTIETFRITGPVSLTVGNASGVDAVLRGTPIELQVGAKSNVARLNLK
ncbi:MAG: hypothetical protein JWQ21_1421 [Herminiimonas sp.]|nr:hypothetical protein [Herminiimonas sp.]